MSYKLDDESRNRLEDLSDLRDYVSAIRAQVHACEDGQDEIQVLISLLSSFPIADPSAETGKLLNSIATAVRQRVNDLPVSTVISFSKEGEE
jgi:N-methylhydantoinase B/oxoprolinase/acetone carboxylase alpha subunit